LVLVGNPEGRRPLGRPRHRWEYDIKIKLKEIGCKNLDWVHWGAAVNFWIL